MSFRLLSPRIVELLHDSALNPGELQGRAQDKSLESTLARVDNRLAYGMIEDEYDLAAAYATAIACGHCFNDGNKRTAFRSMNAVLRLNGVHIKWNTTEIGDAIIRLAQGHMHDEDLATFLRNHPQT
ncbi:type II toxin-antitoxin system death-on-curing family toxin [Amylibacter sp.]|nr:type II toxin-antitoxin system death-on-curing family toxin [Amylibacter sp.]